MNSDSQYAFYGTLRRGEENYALYRQDLIYLRTVILPGYKMYSLREYPYIIKSEKLVDTIVADLFKITSAETEQMIHEMELEAGYVFSEVEIADIKFGIYLFKAKNDNHPEVGSGDWSSFRKLTGF
jgi:gamma-glutamylcyclotransferase (GGCT)/AIG2-like uncharacterized protein YtfP